MLGRKLCFSKIQITPEFLIVQNNQTPTPKNPTPTPKSTPTPKNPTPTPKEDDVVESPYIEDGDDVNVIDGKYVFGSNEYKTPYTIGTGTFVLKCTNGSPNIFSKCR